MTVTAPSDRNFRRRRVKPGRRASLRHRWKALAVAGLAAAAAMAVVFVVARAVTSSSRLSVARIVVTGTERLAGREIDALLGGMRGANLLTLDLDSWHEKLRSSGWVDTAVIRRVFPDAVSVSVFERVAVGVGRFGDTQYLIDRTGSAIDPYGPHYADLDLPIVDGLSAGSPGMEKADARRVSVALRLFSALQRRSDLARRISQIDLTDPGDVVFLMNEDNSLVHAGDDHFIERLQNYVDFAEAVHEKVPDIDYIDLRYTDQIIVRSRGENIVARRTPRRTTE